MKLQNKIYNIRPYISNESEFDISKTVDYDSKLKSVIDQFEYELNTALNTEKEICALNSGTAALHLALVLSNVGKNDVVFCSSATYIATASSILYVGAQPHFVDVNSKTGNMNIEYLETAILNSLKLNKKIKAIIITHSYGIPAEMNELIRLKNKYNLVLIEDAAEAIGSKYRENSCGAIGDYGVLSFNKNKLMTTLGGGALIVNSSNEKDRVKSLASHARIKGPDFKHENLAYNYRMNELAARLGLHQLTYLEDQLNKKRTINKWYNDAISGLKEVTLLHSEYDSIIIKPNQWMNCVRFEREIKREDVFSIFYENHIELRGLWIPLNEQNFLSRFPYTGNNETKLLFERSFCFPSGLDLDKKDITRVKEVLSYVLKG